MVKKESSGPRKPAKLADVAQAAGVSVPTASQVINGTGRVAEETRRRVLEVARLLDYRPNALARSVAMGRSRTIGVLAENASGAFCMPVLVGITHALAENDLASILFDARHDADLRGEHVRHMVDRQVDGILVIGEGPDVAIEDLGVPAGIPVVHAFGPHDAAGTTSVHPDEFAAGVLAATQLLDGGRTRLAHVTADADLPSVRARREGFHSALRDRGLEAVAVLHGAFSRDWGARAADRLLDADPAPDAVFAGSDAIAVGLAAGFEARGVRVPDDVAIIGYDHIAGYSEDVDPYLASIDPRLMTVGEQAARCLVALLDGQEFTDVAVAPSFATGVTLSGRGDERRSRLVETLLLTTTAPPVGGAAGVREPS